MGRVAIFWDFENCRPPSSLTGYFLADKIRRIARPFGAITQFKAYLELTSDDMMPKPYQFQSELQSSGVSLIHCPHNGRKDVADKMIIVDMLAFAIDQSAPATVVLITGDRDFAYAISILKLRGYEVILVAPPDVSHESLKNQASVFVDWRKDVLRSNCSVTGVTCNEQNTKQELILSESTAEVVTGRSGSDVGTHKFPLVETSVPELSSSLSPSVSERTIEYVGPRSSSCHVENLSSATEILSGACGKKRGVASSLDCEHDCSRHDKDKTGRDDSSYAARVLPLQPLEASFSQRESLPLLEDSLTSDVKTMSSSNDAGVDPASRIAISVETRPAGDEDKRVDQDAQRVRDALHEDEVRSPRSPTTASLPPKLSQQTNMNHDHSAALTESESAGCNTVLPDSKDKTFNICSSTPIDSHVDASSAELPYCDNPRPSSAPSYLSPLPPCLSGPSMLQGDVGSESVRANPCTSARHGQEQNRTLASASHLTVPTPNSGPGALVIDERFAQLILFYKEMKERKQVTKIRSSELAVALLNRDPLAYEKAGTTRLKQFIDVARQARVIVSPGLDENGDGWVEIDARYYDNSSTSSAFRATQVTRISQPASLNPPDIFIPLLSVFRQHGFPRRTLFSQLGAVLRQNFPFVYQRANVLGLSQYLDKAAKEGIVTVGDLKSPGRQWVELSASHIQRL